MAVAELSLPATDLLPLAPAELESMQGARPERVAEFRAGRHCARLALAALGFPGAVIPRAPDRSPVWPPDFVASITHTRVGDVGYAAAAAARRGTLTGLGIDAEQPGPLEPRLARRILTPREAARAPSGDDLARGLHAKLCFCAKEAAYKCQHPLTGTFLEFGDVEIEPGGAPGAFTAILLRSAGPLARGTRLEGRAAVTPELVLAVVTLR